MGISEIIRNRRSIRKYKKEDIDYEIINQILEDAIWAPSSGNLQNWYFIVVKDPEKKEKISKASQQEFVKDAPVLIVVCSDTKLVESVYFERGKLYAIQNVSAAIQNILLSAAEKGLGTCWIGYFDENAIKEILEIPKNIEVHAIITLGYPDENPKPPERIGIGEKVFYEKWGNKTYKPQLYPIIENLKKYSEDIVNTIKKLKF